MSVRNTRRPKNKGRGPLAKRWIVWKRRYSNPTARDWLLLGSFVWLVVGVGLAFVAVRYFALSLAVWLVVLAVIRMAPPPFRTMWSNRSVMADVATLVMFAGLLTILVFTVPGV